MVLNKSDQVDQQQLMRVYGALMWSLGKVFRSPEVCRVYIGRWAGAGGGGVGEWGGRGMRVMVVAAACAQRLMPEHVLARPCARARLLLHRAVCSHATIRSPTHLAPVPPPSSVSLPLRFPPCPIAQLQRQQPHPRGRQPHRQGTLREGAGGGAGTGQSLIFRLGRQTER